MTDEELRVKREKSIKSDLMSVENKIRHAFNQGYELALEKNSQNHFNEFKNEWKDAYNKGYADGQKALAEHIRLCKEEQEPKTGHWIEEFVDTEGEVRFTCSCCGKYQLFGTDFCYNCGAKMESEE